MGMIPRAGRLAAAILVTIAALVGAVALPAGAAPVAAGTAASVRVASAQLTGTGAEAIDDLRTCLASRSTLNVYYLVDNSGSLRDQGGEPGTDPDKRRAPILAETLGQLGALGADVAVNWGLGFFSTDFEHTIGWSPWTADSASELQSAIEQREPRGWTNWLAAFQGVQQQLAAQPEAGAACQLVIWLTDGAINLNDSTAETATALNQLCGRPIDPAGEPPSDYGVLAALRQSGVVVIGTLLATTPDVREKAAVMWPLVEGAAPGSAAPECGPERIPEGAVRGAVVDASDPGALAAVFLDLATEIAGGSPQALGADGGFWVDAGVSRFQAIVAEGGDWTLRPPADSGLPVLTPAAPGPATVRLAPGGVVIEVPVEEGLIGRWTAAGDARVFQFSDLRVDFDERSEIGFEPDGSLNASLSATVRTASGEPADLSVYGAAVLTVSLLADGVRYDDLPAELDLASGAITIPLPNDLAATEAVVTARIDPLTTAPNGVELAPIAAQEGPVLITLPGEYPTVETSVTLSTLEGRGGVARGTIVASGPEAGGSGTVCLAGDPRIVADNAGRDDTWSWSVVGLGPDGCVTVAAGESVELRVEARNEVAAEARVEAAIPFTLEPGDAAAGRPIPATVAASFGSTHPVNTLAVLFVALGLMLLGLLVPLLVLWLVARRTATIEAARNVQRAAFPVILDGTSGEIVEAPPAEDGVLAERFRYLGDVSGLRVADPDLGALRARVPFSPWREPSYRIEPAADRVVLTASAGRRGRGRRPARPDGAMDFDRLPLDALWALVAARRDLGAARVPATLVMYHAATPDGPDQYRERMRDVLGALPERVKAELARRRATQPRAAEASAPPADAASGRPAAPPPRSGTAPPPLPPRRTGAPPPPPRR